MADESQSLLFVLPPIDAGERDVAFEGLRKFFHVVADFLIEDFTVNLRCLNALVPEHLADRFHWNAVRQTDLRGVGVAGKVT